MGDVTTITETIEDEFRLSAQFWHRFGMVGLRAGLIDSRGGVGLDAYLLDDRLRIQLDAFDFDRQIADIALAPRHRALVDIKVLKHLYLVAGVEDPIFADQRDFYFGAGVRFFDPDLERPGGCAQPLAAEDGSPRLDRATLQER